MDTNTLLLIAIGCLLFFIILRPNGCQHENFDTSRPFVTMTGTNPIRQRSNQRSGFHHGSPYPPNYYNNYRRRNWSQPPYYGSHYYSPNYYDTNYYYENPYTEPLAMESNPGMYTSVYPDTCSRYGSSVMDVDPATYYMGSPWCPVGIAMSIEEKEKKMYALEARFIGNSWSFRTRDNISQLYIYLNQVGTGPYGAYRDKDKIQIPGKTGEFTVQIQTQHNPYLLYLPN